MFGNDPAIDWFEIFGNRNAIEIEIGCGKGAFLLSVARENPARNFFGIEAQARWVEKVRERLEANRIDNARILHADATPILTHFIRHATVRAYHVYFPDPWWKRRHHKRRFLTSEVAAAMRRTLEPGGTVHVATDVADRFDGMMRVLADAGFREIGDESPDLPVSGFERKYLSEGRPVYRSRLGADQGSSGQAERAQTPPASGGKTSNTRPSTSGVVGSKC